MRNVQRWLVVALCVAIGWFYVWTVRSSGEAWSFGTEHRDYYNLLIDGYLEGQLHMKVSVPEALLQLRNPYDPTERPAGLGLHDASFYKGRYYVYFGAAPMMVLMLPFRLLTGMDLPLVVAVLVFVYAGFLIGVRLWLAVKRRYFSETSLLTTALGVLVLGLAGPGPVLLRRPDMWELPIAGGYCFAMLTLAAIWRSLHSDRNRLRWFVTAGLTLGLAIASRPTYLIGAPLLLAPLAWWWRQERQLPWRAGLGVLVPLAFVGGLMAWHNYARFGDPLEFGQAYQFSLDYESKLPHFRAAYVPYTAKAHFFSAARWFTYYPFIKPADLGAAPEGFTIHRGDLYGVLVNFPIAWLAFVAPLALWRRTASERGPLGAWLASGAMLFVLVTGVMLFFFSALARYQMDFVPVLMLLAAVGLLALERWLQQIMPAPVRVTVRALWISAAVFSVLFGVLFSLQFDGLLGEHNPELERDVARRLNRISPLIERMLGLAQGPVEITLHLPASRPEGSETLLTAGEAPRVDRVFVRYAADGRVQFGLAPHGSPELLSRRMSLDRTTNHQLRVTMRSLYPPSAHPYFSSKPAEEVRRITREVRLELNNEPVLINRLRPSDLAGARLRVGASVLPDAAYPPFRGTVSRSRRIDRIPGPASPAGPFARLRVVFNEEPAALRRPLVSFGEPGSGALLTVRQIAAGKFTFGFQRIGAENIASRPIDISSGRAHELVLRFELAGEPRQSRLLLWCDAELIWAPTIPWDSRGIQTIVIGQNRIGLADCAASLGGALRSAEVDTEGRDPLGEPGDLRLRVRLPAGRTGQREPLVATGCSGAGDILVIHYVDGNTVRFGLDHWGTPMDWSEPVPIDFDSPHTLDVAMGSLRPVADATLHEAQREKVAVAIDARPVWTHEGFFHPSEADEVVVGRNPIGGTSCGPAFGGEILAAQRVPRE